MNGLQGNVYLDGFNHLSFNEITKQNLFASSMTLIYLTDFFPNSCSTIKGACGDDLPKLWMSPCYLPHRPVMCFPAASEPPVPTAI